MANLIDLNEFENSFKGLKKIIQARNLYKKKPYVISFITIFCFNVAVYFLKSHTISLKYYDILKIFIEVILPPFVTFCGFTMTAYSLVVGFLNYGIFKNTIEIWYRNRIISKEIDGSKKPNFSLYQNGIALFAFAVLVLLTTVIYFLILMFVIKLKIETEDTYAEALNAILFLLATLLSGLSILLMIYNIVNIFTFSQTLNQIIYIEEYKKSLEKEQEN